MSRAATSLILVVFSSPLLAGPEALLDPDAALAKSQATGRPVLAIAGSTGCVWCKKMAAELAAEPTVQEPADKFVVLLLDTDDPVRWPRWNSRYKVEGEGIPAVFVVRADGEQIYGGNGAPQDLAAFLKRRLEDAGTVPDDAALADLTATANTLARSWRRRDPREVIPELTKRLDPKNYSLPARQIASIVEQMREIADGRLAEAERQLSEPRRKPDAAFEAAVGALEVRRDYAELPRFGEDLGGRIEAIEKDPENASLFGLAARVVEADSLYESGKREEAIAALQALSGDADASAAAYSRRTLARWEKGKKPGAEPAEGPDAAAADESSERAAVQLRLGKAMLARDAAKARKYFENAVKLAPGSPAAAEATELLGR